MVLFLHANGFPTGTYRVFMDVLSRDVDVIAPDIVATPAACCAQERWPNMVAQVTSLLTEHGTTEAPITLVGHSMGGYLSLIAAAQNSQRVARVILIDAPVVAGWRSWLLSAVQSTSLADRVGPAAVAARRRYVWESLDQARTFFAGKEFAANWVDGALDDFLTHGLASLPDGSLTLRVPRETERDIYAHLPTRVGYKAYRSLANEDKSVHLIAGGWSQEINMAGRHFNEQLFSERFHPIDAGHLVPMENPQVCAQLVIQAIACA